MSIGIRMEPTVGVPWKVQKTRMQRAKMMIYHLSGIKPLAGTIKTAAVITGAMVAAYVGLDQLSPFFQNAHDFANSAITGLFAGGALGGMFIGAKTLFFEGLKASEARFKKIIMKDAEDEFHSTIIALGYFGDKGNREKVFQAIAGLNNIYEIPDIRKKIEGLEIKRSLQISILETEKLTYENKIDEAKATAARVEAESRQKNLGLVQENENLEGSINAKKIELKGLLAEWGKSAAQLQDINERWYYEQTDFIDEIKKNEGVTSKMAEELQRITKQKDEMKKQFDTQYTNLKAEFGKLTDERSDLLQDVEELRDIHKELLSSIEKQKAVYENFIKASMAINSENNMDIESAKKALKELGRLENQTKHLGKKTMRAMERVAEIDEQVKSQPSSQAMFPVAGPADDQGAGPASFPGADQTDGPGAGPEQGGAQS